MEKFKKLSKTELQFMKIIWNYPNGVTSEFIYSQFNQALGTKSTILHRITEKGYTTLTKKGKKVIYTANISQAEYEEMLINQTMSKLTPVLCSYFNDTKLTDSQLKRLRHFLNELKQEL